MGLSRLVLAPLGCGSQLALQQGGSSCGTWGAVCGPTVAALCHGVPWVLQGYYSTAMQPAG